MMNQQSGQNSFGSFHAQSAAGGIDLSGAITARNRRRTLWVLLAGAFTSLLAMTGVYVVDRAADMAVMGYYVDYILPVGAIGAGLVAATGFVAAARRLGAKIRRGVLAASLLILLAAYFAADYVEFRLRGPFYSDVEIVQTPDGPKYAVNDQMGYFEYFHHTAVNWAWKPKDEHEKASPLGGWGYIFRILGIVGFVGGGLLGPAMMMARPYCDTCQTYMKSRALTLIPASPFGAGGAQSEETARAQLERFTALASAGDATTFAAEAASFQAQRKQIDKLPKRLALLLSWCPVCSAGIVKATLHAGHGKTIKLTKLGETDLSPDFVRAIDSHQAAGQAS